MRVISKRVLNTTNRCEIEGPHGAEYGDVIRGCDSCGIIDPSFTNPENNIAKCNICDISVR